jgi:hypothetical protein
MTLIVKQKTWPSGIRYWPMYMRVHFAMKENRNRFPITGRDKTVFRSVKPSGCLGTELDSWLSGTIWLRVKRPKRKVTNHVYLVTRLKMPYTYCPIWFMACAFVKHRDTVHVHAIETQQENGRTAPLFLSLGTRLSWVVNFTSWSLYPRERTLVAIE